MPHFLDLWPGNYFRKEDFEDREGTFTIQKIFRTEVFNPENNQKESKTIIEFEEKRPNTKDFARMICNVTNGRRIAAGFGNLKLKKGKNRGKAGVVVEPVK